VDGGRVAQSRAALLPHGGHRRSFAARTAELNSWTVHRSIRATMCAGCWKRIVRRRVRRARCIVRTDCSRPDCTNAAYRWKRSRTRSSWLRPAGAVPLGTIRSLAYFSPVIEEVLQLQVGPEYFQYLRHKLQRAASAR